MHIPIHLSGKVKGGVILPARSTTKIPDRGFLISTHCFHQSPFLFLLVLPVFFS
jgi:hypothetical protein